MRRTEFAQVLVIVFSILAWSAPATGNQSADAESQAAPESGDGMPIAWARSNYYGFAELVDPLEGTFEEELETSMIFTEVSVRLPLPFADRKIVLMPRLFFEHTHLEYRGWDFNVTPANEQLTDFYATGFEIGVINELTERVWFISRLSWGLYSDLKEIDENDARLYGIAMLDMLVAEGAVVGIGLSYDSEFGFPTPLPFLHLAYRGDWFRGEAYIPSSAELFVLPHQRFEIGIRARLVGNEYRMTYEDDEWNNLLVQLSLLEIGGVLAGRVWRGFWLEGGAGVTVNNHYKAVLPDGNTLREISFRPTWFANLGVVYRL